MTSTKLPNNNTILSSWYTDDSRSLNSSPIDDVAQGAFNEALQLFTNTLTKDLSKKAWLVNLQCSNIEDVQSAALDARKRYEDKSGSSKLRHCLTSFSQKVLHYGKILDVFVQHHPEYVSLVWGTMRILFMGVAEQENLLSTITEGLNQVADSLPRAEISARLYPVPRMKSAISRLYAHVIKFLIRAFSWYCEGRLLHAYHAIARPAALRYDDLIKQIRESSAEVSALASVSSQAEQRDMHLELRSLSDEVRAITGVLSQLQQIAIGEQTINAAARIDFQQSFYELKISQVFAVLTTGSSIDPQKSLTACRFLRNRRRQAVTSPNLPPWIDQNMHRWNDQKESAMVLLRGSISARFEIKDFCADLVEYLQENNTAVLWILKGLDLTPCANVSVIDILRNMVLQALQIRSAKLRSGVDTIVAQQLPRFLNARTREDWLDVLTQILCSFSVVYIVVDTKAVSPIEREGGKATENGGQLIETIALLFERLTITKDANSPRCIVKIVLAHYGPAPVLTKTPVAFNGGSRQFVVQVGQKGRSGRASAKNQAIANSTSSRPQQYGHSSRGSTRGLPRRPKKKRRLT